MVLVVAYGVWKSCCCVRCVCCALCLVVFEERVCVCCQWGLWLPACGVVVFRMVLAQICVEVFGL